MSAANTGDYVTASPVTVSAADDFSSRTITFEATYSDDLKAAALDAIVAKVKSCTSVENAGNLDEGCPNEVRSKTLSVLNLKEMPTFVTAEKNSAGVYVMERVKVTKQEGVGIFKDANPKEVTYTVRARVRTDENGAVTKGKDGKPEFDISWSVF